jgi:hypothetical protein
VSINRPDRLQIQYVSTRVPLPLRSSPGRTRQLQDRGQGKTPRLQETDLTRLFAFVGGRLGEAPLPEPRAPLVVDTGLRQCGVDIAGGDAFRFQLPGDAAPAVAAFCMAIARA